MYPATSIVVPSTMADSVPYTNGHSSPITFDTAVPSAPSPPSEDAASETQEAAAASSDEDGDADADGEEYDEDERMEVDAESSEEDAEGEADSDFGSDSPPPEEDRRRAGSSTSQESNRPSKRKASVEDDFEANPELYGLRRSVSDMLIASHLPADHSLGPSASNPPHCWYSSLVLRLCLTLFRSIALMKRMPLILMCHVSDKRPHREKVHSCAPLRAIHHH